MLSTLLALVSLAPAEPVIAQNGMVATAEPHATAVGVEILKKGGNAFDAAAAVGFALAVTYPAAGNIGGGGFALMLTKDGRRHALDFRETAPAAATKDMFLDSLGNVIAKKSTFSHHAAGVPGTVDGLLQMHSKFGKLSRRQILEPAIRLAAEGFVVPERLSDSLGAAAEELTRYAATRAVFYPNGKPIAAGSLFKQQDLASTLRQISDQGRGGFYEGPVAGLIADEMRTHGGLITLEDLAKYTGKWRQAYTFGHNGHEIITMPLPSSGGPTLAQILGLTRPADLKSAGYGTPEYINRLVEAERLAYADRNEYLGDPDFIQVPLAKLTSKKYLEERRKSMPPLGTAGTSAEVKPGLPEKEETTHYCVVDKAGNVVAVTYTLNGSYGMGAVVKGAGFLLNNEMDDFTSKPGVPNMFGLVQSEKNAIAPGKRMLSSMTPTIVRKDGRFAFTVGSPGGSTIITTVLQSYLNMTLFGMNIREAIDAPRFHHQWLPDDIAHEKGAFSPEVAAAMEKMGYKLTQRSAIGIAAGIAQTSRGFEGWSDRRGYGTAAGY